MRKYQFGDRHIITTPDEVIEYVVGEKVYDQKTKEVSTITEIWPNLRMLKISDKDGYERLKYWYDMRPVKD